MRKLIALVRTSGRWVGLAATTVLSWLAVRPFVASRGEAFWLLVPAWVGLGAGVWRVIPWPRLPAANRHWRRCVPAILILFPAGFYLYLTHLLRGRILWLEIGVAIYFFALSLEAILCYLFEGRAWLERRWARLPSRNVRAALAVLARAGFYCLLFTMLLAVFSLHRVKIAARQPEPEMGLRWEPVVFPSRGARPLLLSGRFFPCDQPIGSVLACHGVGANQGDLTDIVLILHQQGLQVLTFDFRGHGTSAGHTVTYGHLEREDVLGAWDHLRARTDVDPTRLFALGVSMGGASLLLALPELDGVRAAVVDSAFAELRAMVEHQYRWLPHAAARVLASLTAACGWVETGIRVHDVSPLRALERTDVPICFIHGGDDTIVPVGETRRLHAAYNGPKRLWIQTAAGHGGTAAHHPERYGRRVKKFFEAALSAERTR